MKSLVNNVSSVPDCTGCSACVSSCPKNAIQMVPDKEGFNVPIVDGNICVNCGVCLKVCQQRVKILYNRCLSSYIAVSRLPKIYKKAASGGIFGTLAYAFLSEEKRFVCGAAFYENKVQHIMINERNAIWNLQNSKYVQSHLNLIFKEVKEKLQLGNEVLFSGTPCQIQGLYNYLKQKPANLLTIDLVCHGVPSPAFLQKDLMDYGCTKIKNIGFRWKNVLLKKSTFFMTITRHEVWLRKIRSFNADPYCALFMRNASFRECCYHCKFSRTDRVADISLGDCHISSLYPEFHPRMATSTVMLNTPKGVECWNRYKSFFDFLPMDLSKEAKINTQLARPAERPFERNEVYKDLARLSFSQFRAKYGRFDSFIKEKILQFIDLIPIKV